MSHRIDIFERFELAYTGEKTHFIGYGYRFLHEQAPYLREIAKALTDEKTSIARIDNQEFSQTIHAPYIAEVRFRAGVTDNAAKAVNALLALSQKRLGENWGEISCSSSRIYLLQSPEDVHSVYNPLIETAECLSLNAWREKGFSAHIPEVQLIAQPRSMRLSLEMSDEDFLKLSKEGILDKDTRRGPLGLGLDDLYSLRDYYRELGRDISDIELETFAQSWSEHCKHRFFAASIDDIEEGLFRRYIYNATKEIMNAKPGFCLSVFHDNAGGIAFGENHIVAYKVETHNSPSALDPYGGAMTGVLGVNRDCLGFGMGAEPLANMFGYCLPMRDDESQYFRQNDGSNPLPDAQSLSEGVIKGIEEGGNHSGIPTIAGFIYEDESYRGKPLVYCGTLGILPKTVNGPEGVQSSVEKSARAGDYIYIIGNRVGHDGIHGATFSSVELDANSPATAVQIGDPITQKNLQDALFRAREKGLYRAITDNGAGGLSSSIGEMAEGSGGAEVWLEKVLLKYPGLAPWEIWISESQERMSLSVTPELAQEFEALFAHYDVEYQWIGRFTDDQYLRLCYEGEEIGTIEMDYLHNGAPKRKYQSASSVKPIAKRTKPIPKIADILSLKNFQSRAEVFRRYDHEVQGKSLIKPLINGVESMASALRPVPNAPQAVALSMSYMPYLVETDPYQAGYASVDLSIRRLIAAGCNPEKIAILDNFCWSRPETAERLFALKETARGLHDAAMNYLAPIVSGKDSMYNDFRGYDQKGAAVEISALPTLLISAFGVMDNYQHSQSFAFAQAGDYVALFKPNAQNLSRTMIDQERHDGGSNIAYNPQNHSENYQMLYQWMCDERLASVEALGQGGIGFALMRAAMASGLGGEFAVEMGELGAFDEWDSGFLISYSPKEHEILKDYVLKIGEVGGADFAINDDAMSVQSLRKRYFSSYYGGQNEA